ncbi:MAG: elongation factor Ts [Clostridia bacterium]|nr:elongation factor Ts [Clostridia bacterium]
MAQITAKAVAELRAKTGCGMMDCKKALVEADGNMEEAVKILREKGLSAAVKKEGRIAADGLVDILVDGDVAAMIEVNTETDFVAKNASFQEYVKALLKTIIANKPADLAAFMACTIAGGDTTVEASLTEQIFKIGEKITIRRFVIVEGTVATYIHGLGNTGVIVAYDVDDAVKAHADFAETAKNITLQIAAGSPPTYIAKEDVPQSAIDEEMGILMAQAKNDPKLASKPEEVLKKILSGKLGKFYERVCLLDQPYVKEDSLTVGKYLDQAGKAMGGKITVKSFVIYEKGEGIAKREDNFADEIAKMVNKG